MEGNLPQNFLKHMLFLEEYMISLVKLLMECDSMAMNLALGATLKTKDKDLRSIIGLNYVLLIPKILKVRFSL